MRPYWSTGSLYVLVTTKIDDLQKIMEARFSDIDRRLDAIEKARDASHDAANIDLLASRMDRDEGRAVGTRYALTVLLAIMTVIATVATILAALRK